MPVTKVKTGWSSGDLVFKKKSDNSTLMSIMASTGDINIPTGVTLTVTDGITGLSLDAAYNAGRTITCDAGAVIIAGANATANALQVTEAAGSGNLIDLAQSGTGKDIDGTSSTWSVTKTGGGTFATLASGVVTLSAGLDMSASGTGSYDFTLNTNQVDALSIKDSAGDLIVFRTTTGSQLVTITPATTVSGLLTASAALTVTTGALTVSAGGGSITGGLTVVTGGLTVSAGTTSAITSTNINLTGIVGITGATTVTGNLTVTGSLTWGGPTAINEALTVDELILDTDGAALANNVCGLWRDNAGDASLQAVSGKEVKFLIASNVEMQIGGTETIINELSGDRNFRVESADLQYALYVDGGKNTVEIGGNTDVTDVDTSLRVSTVAKTITSGENYALVWIEPVGAATFAGVNAITASLYIKEPNLTDPGAGSSTVAATVYIADAPTEGDANHALYVASGSVYMAGALTVAGATSLDGGAFTFNDTSADLDFRVESNNLQYALYVDGGKDSVVIGDNTDKSDVDVRLWVGNVAKTLLDNESAAILVVAPTGATTESGTGATTHAYIATAYFAEPSITHGGTSAITTAATVYIADAPTEGDTNNAALYIASGALIMASGSLTLTSGGITLTNGNLTFSAASDIIMPAATAAALEISDATTKYYAIDTRVATTSITTHTWNISAYTIASAATNVETGWSFAAHTLNYTGNTQVTTQVDTIVMGARTIAADGVPGALTVDEGNSLLLVAPTEGTNVVLTTASALRIINAGGTPVNQYGLYIEDLTVGATLDVGIYLAGADSAAIYVAADPIQVADSVVMGFGSGTGVGAYDASILYNGTNLVVNPRVIGTGIIVAGNGEGGTVAGNGTTIRTINVITGGLGNIAGADLTFAAGLGTGTGTRGNVIIQTPQVAAAGDNAQTLETMMTFGEDITTLKGGAVFQSSSATEIGISVTNAALVVGTSGSLVAPYLNSTGAAFSDAIGGDNDGCIGINYDNDTGPTATLEARVNGGWLSVAVTGIEMQGKTFGGGKKHGEKWHPNQILGEDTVDETICAVCGNRMKVGEKLVLYANYERTTPDGVKNLHAIFCHAGC